MWTIFKVFIEFVTILLLFYVLVFFCLKGMWHLSSLTRDRTHAPCIGRQTLNYWTAREVPAFLFLLLKAAADSVDSLMTIQHLLRVHRPSVGSCQLKPGLLILVIVFLGPQLSQPISPQKGKGRLHKGSPSHIGLS